MSPEAPTPRRRQNTDPDDRPVQVNIRLPASLRDQIDARRKVKGMSRDLYIANALRYVLQQQAARRPLTTSSGRTAPPPRHRP